MIKAKLVQTDRGQRQIFGQTEEEELDNEMIRQKDSEENYRSVDLDMFNPSVHAHD